MYLYFPDAPHITLSWSSQKTYRTVNWASPVRLVICTLKTLELTLLSEEISGICVRHWPGSLILCFMTPSNWPRNNFFFDFTFMGPCIINVFKHKQQDAMLHNDIYYYKCSTCFRRFLHPSSGAQKCIHGIGYLSSFFSFLPLSWVSWNSPTIAVRNRKNSTNTRCFVYSFELLMMRGGTAWNM